MQQDRLFRLPVAAITVTAYYEAPEGWRLVITARRADESWTDTRPEWYSHLTSNEMLDVLSAALATQLGVG